MYHSNEFYFLTDRLHHDVYRIALKDYIDREERLIVKVFKKDKEIVVIETCNGVDSIIIDNRKDKNDDILSFDLVFLKMMDRYISSYEIKNMHYEAIDGMNAWCRVKIDGFDPNDKDLSIFYKKRKVTLDSIKNSDNTNDVKNKQLKFLKIVKDFKFTNPKKVKKFFEI